MFTIYKIYLLLHLLGVILLLGTFIQAFVAKGLAQRSQNIEFLKNAFDLIHFNDQWITPLSIFLILLSGIFMCLHLEMSIIKTRWVFWSLNLFGLAGLIFLIKILPLQKRIEKNLQDMSEKNLLQKDRYHEFANQWNKYAYLSFGIMIIIFGLMIFQPALKIF